MSDTDDIVSRNIPLIASTPDGKDVDLNELNTFSITMSNFVAASLLAGIANIRGDASLRSNPSIENFLGMLSPVLSELITKNETILSKYDGGRDIIGAVLNYMIENGGDALHKNASTYVKTGVHHTTVH